MIMAQKCEVGNAYGRLGAYGIYFLLHVIQAAVIAVGDDGRALFFESFQVVDDAAAKKYTMVFLKYILISFYLNHSKSITFLKNTCKVFNGVYQNCVYSFIFLIENPSYQ